MPGKLEREGRVLISASAKEESRRVANQLLAKIRRKGFSIRAVEERLGWKQGVLNDILSTGRAPFRVSHIAVVCEAIDIPLSDFYRELAEERDREVGQARPTPPKEGPLSREERREILDEVRDLIRRHRGEG